MVGGGCDVWSFGLDKELKKGKGIGGESIFLAWVKVEETLKRN